MRDIAFAVFIFGMIPYILMRPFVGLLLWSWIGYMNPHRLCWGFAYSFPWVQLVAITTLVSLMLSKERKTIRMSPTVVLFILFFIWTTVTTLFAVEPDSAWQQWEVFGKVLIMVLVTLVLVKDKQQMNLLVWMIVVSLGFYGLKGGAFTILTGGGSRVYGPANSFIANNNDLAQALCMVLPLIRYLQLQASKKYMKVGLGFAMFLTGIAILGTYSRGGLITLAVVSAALFLKGRRRIPVIVVLAALALTAYHFMPAQWTARMDTLQHGDQVDTAKLRIQTWEFATNVALHRPLVGGGFNEYESTTLWNKYAPAGAVQRAVHSIYFRVLGENGFPGLVLFLALLFVSWRTCSRIRRNTRGSPQDKWAFDLASMLQVSLLAFMTAGAATTSSYFDLSYQLMAMCTLLTGMVADRSSVSVASGAADRRAAGALEGGHAISLARKS